MVQPQKREREFETPFEPPYYRDAKGSGCKYNTGNKSTISKMIRKRSASPSSMLKRPRLSHDESKSLRKRPLETIDDGQRFQKQRRGFQYGHQNTSLTREQKAVRMAAAFDRLFILKRMQRMDI